MRRKAWPSRVSKFRQEGDFAFYFQDGGKTGAKIEVLENIQTYFDGLSYHVSFIKCWNVIIKSFSGGILFFIFLSAEP